MRKKIKYITHPLAFITMGLILMVGCSDDDPEPAITTVTDIDGNVYQTVTIGFYEWTAENLRVSRYNNGDPIPSGLSDTEWESTTDGAFAIYDHNAHNTEGINSPEEMVEAYGKLYNWYAVNDPRGLCPEGWHVPSDYAWRTTVSIASSQGYPQDIADADNPNGVANALKSCLQVGSPFGEDCDTLLHPRWNSHERHHGFDAFGFAALPGGRRNHNGFFGWIGRSGFWWTTTEYELPAPLIYRWRLDYDWGRASAYFREKNMGFSVRCVREIMP